MRTSRTPWTVEVIAESQPPEAWLKDADGEVIAYFRHANDAEHVVEQAQRIAELEAQIDKLELDNETLADQNHGLRTDIEELEAQGHKL